MNISGQVSFYFFSDFFHGPHYTAWHSNVSFWPWAFSYFLNNLKIYFPFPWPWLTLVPSYILSICTARTYPWCIILIYPNNYWTLYPFKCNRPLISFFIPHDLLILSLPNNKLKSLVFVDGIDYFSCISFNSLLLDFPFSTFFFPSINIL